MEPNELKKILIQAYDHHAQEREGYVLDGWKTEERENFLSLLQHENKKSLLEVGAGVGRDSKFFSDKGLDVTCIDLSPEMVKHCKQKGLAAHVMDMAKLEFQPGTFDAIYSFNSLLHVPRAELLLVLENVNKVLKPAGLFFLGMYGGMDFEDIWEKDSYTPKRFFSFHTDDQIQQLATQRFDLFSFKRIDLEDDDLHFQSLILRKQNP